MVSPGLSNRIGVRASIIAALFAALTAIGAFIRIPLPPLQVHFSLQTLIVLLTGFLLGSRYAATSQVLYLIIGLIGFPVFTQGGGPGYILKPTFGYLLGFPLAAWTVGRIVHGSSAFVSLDTMRAALGGVPVTRAAYACIAGMLAIFVPGVFYLYFISNVYLGTALTFTAALTGGFLIFLPGDVLKIVAIITFIRFFSMKSNPNGQHSLS